MKRKTSYIANRAQWAVFIAGKNTLSSIFNNKEKAIQVCINRFDEETKASFIELYDKVDADFQMIDTEEVS